MLALSSKPPVILDGSFSRFIHNVPKHIRPGNPERPFWDGWEFTFSLYGSHCTSKEYDHDRCWGWTIVRTSYGNDVKFNEAVSAIHRLAMISLEDEYRQSRTRGQPDNDEMGDVDRKLDEIPDKRVQKAWRAMVGPARDALPPGEPATPDWLITHELARHYHCPAVQDKEALQGADASQAWRYTNDNLDLGETEIGPRGEFFIYLDEESIELLGQAPSLDTLASMKADQRSKTAWKFWVKVVQVECGVDEEGEDTFQMSEQGLARRRVRLYDFFETFMHVCSGPLSEMGVEGNHREHFVRHEEREWEFCEAHFRTCMRDPWLKELYGERLPPKWARHLPSSRREKGFP